MLERDKAGVIRAKDTIENTEYRRLCQLENLSYDVAKRNWGFVSKFHKIYHLDKKKKIVYYPRGIENKVEWYDIAATKYDIDYELSIPFDATLRPEQQAIVDQCWDHNLIVAKTWFGKTYLAAWLINKYKVRTLIVCPKRDIARHLVTQFEKTFGKQYVGLFNSKDLEYLPPIMVIVGASFNKYYENLSSHYDMLIIDEAHMSITSDKRLEAYCKFGCKYFFWLTATPKREEVWSQVFNLVFWDWISTWENEFDIDIKLYEYEKKVEMFEDYQDLMNILLNDEERTDIMVEIVKNTMKWRSMGIVFCDRIAMVEALVEGLTEKWVYARWYTASTKDRQQLLDTIHDNNWVMVCTYQTAWVWFDYPPLDTWFYFIPNIKFSSTVAQAVGRILRSHEGKLKPLLIDFHDSKIPMVRSQFRQRKAAYKKYYWEESLSKYEDSHVK